MLQIYHAGLAQGTHKNRSRHAQRYISFMAHHGVEPARAEEYDILQYATHLFSSLRAPGSVRNALSGARAWVAEVGGIVTPFSSHALKRLRRGGDKALLHTVSKAPPLRPRHLRALIQFLISLGPSTLMPVAALLVGYFSFLRQSNLVSPSGAGWGGPHTLRRRDIQPHALGLSIVIHSSKTISSPQDSTQLLVPAVPGSQMCPVSAWRKASEAFPAPGSAPAFLVNPNTPLDTLTLTKILRTSLAVIDVPGPTSYTLHSLRRGAAMACYSLGVSLPAIQAQGTWESKAVLSYVPRRASPAAPVALANYFGRATGSAGQGDQVLIEQ